MLLYLEIIIVAVIMAAICGGLYRLIFKYTSLGFWEPFLMTATGIVVLLLSNTGGVAEKAVESAEARGYSVSGVFLEVLSYLLIITIASSVICVLMLMLLLMFYGNIMIFSKRCKAELVKIEVPAGMHTSFAYYKIEGKVYQCALGGVSKKLVIGNEYSVRLSRFLGKVFDKSAVMTCIAGIFIMLVAIAFFAVPFMILDF